MAGNGIHYRHQLHFNLSLFLPFPFSSFSSSSLFLPFSCTFSASFFLCVVHSFYWSFFLSIFLCYVLSSIIIFFFLLFLPLFFWCFFYQLFLSIVLCFYHSSFLFLFIFPLSVLFLSFHATLRLAVSISMSVGHISGLRVIFALLPLPTRPRLYCRVSVLVYSFVHLFSSNYDEWIISAVKDIWWKNLQVKIGKRTSLKTVAA